MKVRALISLILSLILCLSFFSCTVASNTPGGTDDSDDMDTPAAAGEVKYKFLKAGKSDCVIIRTENSVILLDCAAEDKSGDIITYLAEREITTIDYLILTNFSKSCIGGAAGVIKTAGFTVKNIYEPTYSKDSSTYTAYLNAVAQAGITPVKISSDAPLTVDDIKIEFLSPLKDYSTAADENDEGNSVAVAVTHGKTSFLYTSRVMGDRVTELVSQIDGRTFDFFTVPNFGRADTNSASLFSAVGAKYGVIFASTKNPPETATEQALKTAGITYFITRDGGVEATTNGTELTIKQ